MERSSEFVKNKALFGSYPIQEQVEELEKSGVRYFVDLTCDGETKIIPYNTKHTYMRYPIKDRRVPTHWKSFAIFIIELANIIKSPNNKWKIYIHCKGGHGRAGVVVACLLCYLYGMSPPEALSETKKYHNMRKEMREKWRKMGSPQTRSQKHFVTKFFEPLYIYMNYTTYFSADFSNDADISVLIPGFGLFPTATSAFNSFKDPTNNDYVKKLEMYTDIDEIRKVIKNCPEPDDWNENRENYMYTILKLKFKQHDKLQIHMMNTGLRPIIVRSSDTFWGKMDNTSGKNMTGKILECIRKLLYKNEI